MANQSNLGIPEVCLTSQLQTLEIDTRGDALKLTVTAEGTQLFSNSYYPMADVVRIEDLRSILENDLRLKGTPTHEAVVITAEFGSNKETAEFSAIYCSYACGASSVEKFLRSEFLTENNNSTTCQGLRAVANFFAFLGEDLSQNWTVLFTDQDGTDRVARLRGQGEPEEANMVESLDISYQAAMKLLNGNAAELKKQFPSFQNAREIKTWSVSVGRRQYTVFNSPLLAAANTMQLCFRNIFNCWEYASFACKSTDKASLSKAEATCSGKMMFYDLQPSQTFEVETAEMNEWEIKLAKELVLSHDVRLVPDGDTSTPPDNLPKILITESDFSISNSNDDSRRVKFTYRFDHGLPQLNYQYSDKERIFRSQYQTQFE